MSDESGKLCPKCPEKKIADKDSLKQHNYEYHCNKCTTSVSYEDQTTKITITRENNVLHCPACKESYSSRQNLKTHLNKSKCKRTLFVETAEQNHITKRDYDSAVLNACGGIQFEKLQQQQILKIVEAVNLNPLSLVNDKGVEQSVLVIEEHIHEMCSNKIDSIQPIPKKQKVEENPPLRLNILLSDILSKGAYPKLFKEEQFIKLNGEMIKLLNIDWNTKPHFRYACSTLMAGMIIAHEKKAITVNCLEVYGRTKSLDAHRENFTVKKGRLPSSSVPLTNNLYNNVFVTTIVDNHGEKLIIGTKTFNALSTSSFRLDAQKKPDVEPTTLQFSVPNIFTSNEIKIFINKRSWEHTKEISLDPMNKVIHSYDNLYQLRQVQSKFDHLSTYFRCRAASGVTDGHIYQPYTIFTLADCDNCNEASDGRIASLLFRTIALRIFEEEDRAAEEITGSLKKKNLFNW